MAFGPLCLCRMQAISGDGRVTAVHDAGIHGVAGDESRGLNAAERATPPYAPEKVRFIRAVIALQAPAPAARHGRRPEGAERKRFPQHKTLPETGCKVTGIKPFVPG